MSAREPFNHIVPASGIIRQLLIAVLLPLVSPAIKKQGRMFARLLALDLCVLRDAGF